MAQKTRAYLKSKFEQGDTPTAQDFVDLIDTFFSLEEDDGDNIPNNGVVQKLVSPEDVTTWNSLNSNTWVNIDANPMAQINLEHNTIYHITPLQSNITIDIIGAVQPYQAYILIKEISELSVSFTGTGLSIFRPSDLAIGQTLNAYTLLHVISDGNSKIYITKQGTGLIIIE